MSETRFLLFSPKPVFPTILPIQQNKTQSHFSFSIWSRKNPGIIHNFSFYSYTSYLSTSPCELGFQNVSRIRHLFHTLTNNTICKGVICQDDLLPGLCQESVNWSTYTFIHPQFMIYTIARIILLKHKSKNAIPFPETLCWLPSL